MFEQVHSFCLQRFGVRQQAFCPMWQFIRRNNRRHIFLAMAPLSVVSLDIFCILFLSSIPRISVPSFRMSVWRPLKRQAL